MGKKLKHPLPYPDRIFAALYRHNVRRVCLVFTLIFFLVLLLLDAITGMFGSWPSAPSPVANVIFLVIIALIASIVAMYIDIFTARLNVRRFCALASIYAYSGDLGLLKEAVISRTGPRRILRSWMRLPGEERYVLVCSTVSFGVLLKCYLVIRLNKLGQCRVTEVHYPAMLPNWQTWIHSRWHKGRPRAPVPRRPRKINPPYPSMLPGLSSAIRRAEEDSWSRGLFRDDDEDAPGDEN